MDTHYGSQNPQRYQIERHRHRQPWIIVIVILVGMLLITLWWFRGLLFPQDQPLSPVEDTTPALIDTRPDPFADDQDQDSILDSEEANQGLSDADFDTDGDGLSDSDEINRWGTDPTNTDTDGDGFSDGFELLNGYSPTGAGTL